MRNISMAQFKQRISSLNHIKKNRHLKHYNNAKDYEKIT